MNRKKNQKIDHMVDEILPYTIGRKLPSPQRVQQLQSRSFDLVRTLLGLPLIHEFNADIGRQISAHYEYLRTIASFWCNSVGLLSYEQAAKKFCGKKDPLVLHFFAKAADAKAALLDMAEAKVFNQVVALEKRNFCLDEIAEKVEAKLIEDIFDSIKGFHSLSRERELQTSTFKSQGQSAKMLVNLAYLGIFPYVIRDREKVAEAVS